jgi:hypothetical protein
MSPAAHAGGKPLASGLESDFEIAFKAFANAFHRLLQALCPDQSWDGLFRCLRRREGVDFFLPL